MKRIIVYLCFSLLTSFYGVHAQDQTNFTQFYLNPYLINPSYAGIDGKTAIMLLYRKQWATIQDGPTLSNVSFHTPINKRISLGLSFTSDKKGLLNNSGGLITFAYSVPLSETSFLRFGLSAGASTNTIDMDKLEGFSDPAMANLLDNNSSLLGNSGLSFHAKTFHFGVSMPVIFEPSLISQDAFSITEVKPFETIIIHASNRIYFNGDKNVFEPYMVYRMSSALPPQFEVAALLHLNHVLWMGGSFKQDFGISALGGIKVNRTLSIGGSYSLKNSGANELNSPTYEVSLGLLLGKQRKDAPAYSFINTKKEKKKKTTGKSASEILAEKHRQNEMSKKKQQEELAKKKHEEEQAQKKEQEALALKQQQEAKKKQEQQTIAKKPQPSAEQKKKDGLYEDDIVHLKFDDTPPEEKKETKVVANNTPPVKTLPKEEPKKEEPKKAEPKKEEPKQVITEVKPRVEPAVETPETFNTTTRKDTIVVTHKARFNQVETSMEVLTIEITEHTEDDEKERIARLTLHADDPDEHHKDASHPNADRHDLATKGHHKNELGTGDYVVTGVFKHESRAKHFADGLKKMGFKAKYGYASEKSVWYVYLHQSNNINTAKAERDRYRKMKVFRDAWLLSVHN